MSFKYHWKKCSCLLYRDNEKSDIIYSEEKLSVQHFFRWNLSANEDNQGQWCKLWRVWKVLGCCVWEGTGGNMACAVLIPRVYCRPTENVFASVLFFDITLLKICVRAMGSSVCFPIAWSFFSIDVQFILSFKTCISSKLPTCCSRMMVSLS